MEFQKLVVTKRNQTGKEISRKIRREGQIPAICYKDGEQSTPIIINPKNLKKILQAGKGINTVFILSIEDENKKVQESHAMIQDYQFHPVTRSLTHADLYIVDLEKDLRIKIPLVLTGKAKGTQMGGTLTQIYRDIPVKCKVESIPEKIEFDVTPMELGDTLKISQLPSIPEVEILLPPEQTLASISLPQKEEEEVKPEEAAAAEGGETPAGTAAAAPATGDKKDQPKAEKKEAGGKADKKE